MKLKQIKVVLDAEQLGSCRQTCECDYALEDVTKLSFPGFTKYTEALIEELNGDPLKFVGMGLVIKESAWNDAPLYVSPLEDALKFTDLLDDVTVAEEPIPRSQVVLQAANPVKSMELMNLTEEDLKKSCRMTPEGLLSVYDALTMRDGCTNHDSGKRYNAWSKGPQTGGFDLDAVLKYHFPGSPQPTPVAQVRHVLQLLAIISGPGAARVRNRNAERAARVLASNPVQSIDLMNFTDEDLKKHCRVTPDGMFSVYDALVLRDGSTYDNASRKFRRWETAADESRSSLTGSPEPADLYVLFRFGTDPHPTPVASFHGILRLMAAIPGKGSKIVRSQQAELTTRAMAGDHDLERAIQGRRAALPAAAQEVMLVGLQSSGDAKRMRDEQHELETTSKRPRVRYTGDQLLGIVKGICPDAPPDPAMLLDMWDSSGGNHSDFMALYIKFCEVLFFIPNIP